MAVTRAVRVLIVDDDALVRGGLQLMLGGAVAQRLQQMVVGVEGRQHDDRRRAGLLLEQRQRADPVELGHP